MSIHRMVDVKHAHGFCPAVDFHAKYSTKNGCMKIPQHDPSATTYRIHHGADPLGEPPRDRYDMHLTNTLPQGTPTTAGAH
jgi:hypothetical protein